jgi:hypothetical protein
VALGLTMDVAGYLSQPPLLLTTIQGALALENGGGEENHTVRVAEVTGGPVKTVHIKAYDGVTPKAPISMRVRPA